MITLATLVIVQCSFAQNAIKAEVQNPDGANTINIEVSKFDLEDGDHFFDDASKFERKGDYNEALTLFGKAAFEYNSVKNFLRYGQSIMKMSEMHYYLGRYTDAEQIILNVAIKNYAKISSRSGLMSAYGWLGKIYLAINKYTQSMWFYTQQGILAKQNKNNNAYIESVLGIIQVKIKKRDFNLALKDLKTVELLAKATKQNQYKDQIKDARAAIAAKIEDKLKS